MAEADTATRPASPYDRIGGREPIARMVSRFYDLMEHDADYADLRALHAPDLTPMKGSLTDFLMAWMGGPRDWFEQRPGACMMSAHKNVGVTRETAEQWVSAMRRAAEETLDDPAFVEAMIDAFSQMSMGMARNAG
jgi:hemoglobin